jgi:hypothetical protein
MWNAESTEIKNNHTSPQINTPPFNLFGEFFNYFVPRNK